MVVRCFSSVQQTQHQQFQRGHSTLTSCELWFRSCAAAAALQLQFHCYHMTLPPFHVYVGLIADCCKPMRMERSWLLWTLREQ
jgi:hypothetical protein